jgi:hypothetical protein
MLSGLGFASVMIGLAIGVVAIAVWRYRRRKQAALVSARHLATGQFGIVSGGASGPMAPLEKIDGGDYVSAVLSKQNLKKLEKQMQKVRSKGDESELASLHLLLGQSALAGGDTGKAGAQLRDAVIIASRLSLDDVHAAARLELGDLAERTGDLTTACEHWQMARGLFHKLEAERGFEIADQRMQGNGCPTDWVLNKF